MLDTFGTNHPPPHSAIFPDANTMQVGHKDAPVNTCRVKADAALLLRHTVMNYGTAKDQSFAANLTTSGHDSKLLNPKPCYYSEAYPCGKTKHHGRQNSNGPSRHELVHVLILCDGPLPSQVLTRLSHERNADHAISASAAGSSAAGVSARHAMNSRSERYLCALPNGVLHAPCLQGRGEALRAVHCAGLAPAKPVELQAWMKLPPGSAWWLSTTTRWY